jgi:hypothetical protein
MVLLWRDGADQPGLLAGLEAAVGRAVQQAAEDQHAECVSKNSLSHRLIHRRNLRLETEAAKP